MLKLLVFLALSLLLLHSASAQLSVLKDYVNTPDDSFEWSDTGITFGNDLVTAHVLNITSLTWLNDTYILSPGVWHHYLVMIVPKDLVFTDTAAIWITGNNVNYVPTNLADSDLAIAAGLAVGAQMIVGSLFGVPNFPVTYTAMPDSSMGEDESVFYSWKNYMNLWEQGIDLPEINILFPSTKSSVRAMDVMQEWIPTLDKSYNPESLFVAGASKRGWTTWLVGAVDDRVSALVPIVMDQFDTPAMMQHMWQTYGNWSFPIEPCIRYNLTVMLGTDAMAALSKVQDIKYYTDNLDMPKLVIDGTGDEFFLLDDDRTWWGSLPGETYRLMLPNADHTTLTKLVQELTAVTAFFRSILLDKPRPVMDWSVSNNGTTMDFTTTFEIAPDRVKVWSSTSINPGHRDFRLVRGYVPYRECNIPVNALGKGCVQPTIWYADKLKPLSETTDATTGDITSKYSVTVDPPKDDGAWTGFLIEAYWPEAKGIYYRFTTTASIIPETLPFAACTGEACRGAVI